MDLTQQIEHFLSTNFSTLIFVLVAIVVVIICIRDIRCWYWKIEERLSLQYQEIGALQEIIELQKKEIELLEKALTKEESPDTIDS